MLGKVKDFGIRFLYFLPYFVLASLVVYGIPFIARNFTRVLSWVQTRFPAAPMILGMAGASAALYYVTDGSVISWIPLGLCGFFGYIGEEKTIELERQGDNMVAGGTATFKAPLNYLYKEFFVTCDTVLTAGVAVPVLTQDAESRQAARVILRNGKKDLVNTSGRVLRYFNELENRVPADVLAPAPAVGAMEFANTFNVRCFDSFASAEVAEREYLRAWAMSKLEIEVQLAQLAEMGAAGGGGTLAWTRSDVRVYATVIECSDSLKERLKKSNVLAMRLGWDQEAAALGFAADHQFRTSNLNRDGALCRVMAFSRTGAPPADIRADNVPHAHLTWKEKPVTPLQIPGFFLQEITSQRLGYNPPAGIYLLDCDTEGNHLGLPIPGSDDELSLWYQYPVVAGGALEIVQQSLVAAGYDR